MKILQSILLATDFSEASQEAARVAAQLASRFSARITAFHALEQSWPISSQQYQDLLRQSFADQKVDLTDLLVGWGPPADTILRKAQEINADLIVIGAGKRPRSQRFALGPVATTVIEQAPQPVLAVRPGEPRLQFRKILCPVDQSETSGQGLRNAIRLARETGGELIILTVVPEVSWLTAAAETGHLADAKAEYEKKWRDEFDRFVAGIPLQGVQTRQQVRLGIPHEQILAAAQEQRADLIVLGATGRTGLARLLLGSTTRRLLEELPCSLLVVKQEGVLEELFEGEIQLMQQLLAEGRQALSTGDHELALTRFRQVLTHYPLHGSALEGMADAYQKAGQHERAALFRRRAAQLREKS